MKEQIKLLTQKQVEKIHQHNGIIKPIGWSIGDGVCIDDELINKIVLYDPYHTFSPAVDREIILDLAKLYKFILDFSVHYHTSLAYGDLLNAKELIKRNI